MMFLAVFFEIVISAVISFILLRLLVPELSRRRFLDKPNARSSHISPIPRGGGVVFVLLGSLAGACLGSSFAFACLPLALVGFLDDYHSLPVALRFVVQFLTSLLLVFISPLKPLYFSFFLCLLLLFIIISVINFTNFMDGLDGLVAGCMAVVFSVAALINTPVLWPLVGALFGFLLWNWSPAKVFMGDVGSTFLGAVFAWVVLQQPSFQAALGLFLVATPLLGDACLCVLRRLLARQRVFQAHRLHLFQRLHQAGLGHSVVAIIYIVSTGFLGIGLLAGGFVLVSGLAFGVLLIGLWLDQRVAVPFGVSAAGTSHRLVQF